MGSGKGSPEGWVAVVKPGRVMFELAGVPEPLAREAIRLAGHKLPVQHEVRDCGGRREHEGQPSCASSPTRSSSSTSRPRAASCSGCASSTPPASWRTPPACGSAKRDLARALTIARQRGIDTDEDLDG